MSFDPCLDLLMAQDIWVACPSGTSAYGDMSYGDPVKTKARVEPKRNVTNSAEGDEIVTNFLIYTNYNIGTHDRVWLPGDDQTDDTQARLPAKVDAQPDEDGSISHYEVAI